MPTWAARLVVYGLLGFCLEVVWTACYGLYRSYRDPSAPSSFRKERWRLRGETYLWMFPIYGLGALLFEQIHRAVQGHPFWVRGLSYTVVCFAIEYASGYGIRRLTGRCPWDYSWARFHVHGLIRLDYTPVWFAVGLLFERIHDLLLRLEACW